MSEHMKYKWNEFRKYISCAEVSLRDDDEDDGIRNASVNMNKHTKQCAQLWAKPVHTCYEPYLYASRFVTKRANNQRLLDLRLNTRI